MKTHRMHSPFSLALLPVSHISSTSYHLSGAAGTSCGRRHPPGWSIT